MIKKQIGKYINEHNGILRFIGGIIMKRKFIAITSFMTAALVGCGQINEPLSISDSDNQTASQVDVQTEKYIDFVTFESATEAITTSSVQLTTEKTTEKTIEGSDLSDYQTKGNAENEVTDNDILQQQSETKQPATEAETSAAAIEPTYQIPPQTEAANTAAALDDRLTADVFRMLDSLNYHAISCDGLPTHKLTAPDGTVYCLYLDDTASYSYVWRRPSLIADADNEAPLTQEVIDAIYANWDNLNITECNW